MVLELGLPDQSGFKTLVELVPIASRPHIPVVVLTQMSQRGVSELAKQNGAYACFVKQHTTGEDLDRTIQRAMAFVGSMPKRRSIPISLIALAELPIESYGLANGGYKSQCPSRIPSTRTLE